VLEENLFVERVLPGSVLRPLSQEEVGSYRRPFPTPEDRLPVLAWPREIPIEGQPEDVHRIVEDYARWLRESTVPKLLINAEPGAILVGLRGSSAAPSPTSGRRPCGGSTSCPKTPRGRWGRPSPPSCGGWAWPRNLLPPAGVKDK